MGKNEKRIGILTCDGSEESVEFFADILTGKYDDELNALLGYEDED